MPDGPTPCPEVDQQPSFPDLEQGVIASWENDGTVVASVDQRRDADEFVFYDGPPFADGLPHYGHLLTAYVKHAVPRCQTMRGRRVDRRWGWDCHGLPAEMAAEKALGVTGRAAITERGIGEFNAYCRSLVEHTAGDWDVYVSRVAGGRRAARHRPPGQPVRRPGPAPRPVPARGGRPWSMTC